MRVPSAVCVLALLGGAAHADREEASLALEIGPIAMRAAGYGSATNAMAADSSGTAAGGIAGVRASYGVTDILTLEVGAGALLGWKLKVGGQSLPLPLHATGTEERTDLGLRGTIGATFRLGTRIVPTVTVFTGYQRRTMMSVIYRNAQGADITIDPVPAVGVNELLVGIGVGLGYRVNATWTVEVDVQFVHAFSSGGQSFDAIEAPVSVGGSWYPRRSSPDVLPGGGPLVE